MPPKNYSSPDHLKLFFFSLGQTGSEKVLDPRAGCVNVDMSELDFDAMEIAQILEDMKYQKGTRAKNRKSIDRIVST